MAEFSQALAEAYATQTQALLYNTLEISHPSFTQPIYLVQGYDNVMARIEDGAENNSGQVVEFVAGAWDFVLPEIAEGVMPQLKLTLGNVSREVTKYLQLAAQNPSPIKATYRPYTEDTLLIGPQIDPPLTLEITDATADAYQVTTTANMEDIFNAKFPSKVYKQSTHPTLAYSS